MKYCSIAYLSLIFSLSACAQDIKPAEVPSVVMNAFQAKFQNSTTVEWEKKGGLYEAEFKQNKASFDVQIDSIGNLIAIKQKLKTSELPAVVTAELKNRYTKFKADDADKIERQGNIYYQVELDGKPNDLEIVFDSNGKEMTGISFWD